MMTLFDNIAIRGIVTAVPDYVDECEQPEYAQIMGEKKLRKQIRCTGVERRRVTMKDQKTSDLAIDAVRALLEKIQWSADSVDILILITQEQDMLLPATSMFVHKAFAFKQDMLVFDINLGCSGYTTGLQTVASLLQDFGSRAILMVGDIRKYNSEWKKNGEWEKYLSDWLLIGAGVSATAIEKTDGHNLYGMQYVDSNGCMYIYKEYGRLSRMKGDEVFSFAINTVVDSIREFMDDIHVTDEDIDYYVFHQAQKLILENIQDILEIPEEKLLVSYKDYGNTSGASVPLTMCVNPSQLANGARILMCGFGVGLSWSAVYINLEKDVYLGLVESGHIYSYASD